MNILKKALSFFPRKKPVELLANSDESVLDNGDKNAARGLNEANPEEPITNAVSVNPPSPSSDNVIYIYSHGFTNGVYRVEPDRDSFERFLEYCNLLDRVKDQRELTDKAISDITSRLDVATAAFEADTNSMVEKENLAINAALSLEELEHGRLKKREEEVALINQSKVTVSEYSWVPALLYLAAGITFVIADISITKQITTWGFNMEGWQGTTFAVGLAFTAFLIKPTIDRLLEKPFQAAGLKLSKLYKCVLLLITIVGLAMLFFLGKFRSESEIARGRLDDITRQSSELEPDSKAFVELQKHREEINNSLNQNFMGQTGLTLSGMLFAIGGAICLSISFGSLKQLINRYWILRARIRRLRRSLGRFDNEIKIMRSEHTLIKIEREKAAKKLSNNESAILKDELKKLQEERSALLAEFYQFQYQKEYALYVDGRNKGEKYSIEGELLYKVAGKEHSSLYLGNKEAKDEVPSQASTRSYTRRPFVKMRKMIADNFNKNQNNHAYDGTEFEIIS